MVRPAALLAAHFDSLSANQVPTVRALHDAVLAAVPTLECAIKWGNLCFGERGHNLVAVAAHKAHASLQVFNGAALAADFAQLEGAGKGLRLLKCRYSQPVDVALVQAVVVAAVQAARAA